MFLLASARKKFLVTGGAGFIGSHLARRLIEQGHEVLVVDDLSTGNLTNVPADAGFLNADIGNAQTYDELTDRGVDAVLHLAAQSSGEVSDADPVADLRSNTMGTVRLLDWCLRSGVKRFIFASSMSAYGPDVDLPVTEDSRCQPASFYGISKLAAEHYIRLYREKGLDTTIFRLFNVYGPGQNLAHMKQGMASIYLAYILKKKPVLVKGSLERFRDLVFIDDVVDAWLLALDSPMAYGKTYNLASGRKTLVKDLVVKLLEAAGEDPDRYPIEKGQGTPGDIFGTYADTRLIKEDLGWEPRIELEAGLKQMVDWAQALPAGVDMARGTAL